MVTLSNRLMVMYRRLIQNIKVPQITNKGSNDNGYFSPVSEDVENMIRTDMTTLKWTNNRSNPLEEDSQDPMKILLLFPETSYEAQNIDKICSSLNIEFTVVHSDNEALSVASVYNYDLVIIDCRNYGRESKLIADRFVMNFRSKNMPINSKLISYDDRKSSNDFSQIWDRGYDEKWINYSKTSLRNQLASYLKNQFHSDSRMRIHLLVYSAFDTFMDCIEILNKDFSIELVNATFQKTFKTSSETIKGQNWFKFHDVAESRRETIIHDLNTKRTWEGFISFLSESQDGAANIFAVIKPMDRHDRNYIVTINGLFVSSTRSEQSFNSMERESVTGSSKHRDTYFSTQQISLDSPILKIMKIINSIQEMSNPVINHQLHRIIEILYSKDLFITTVDALKTDKISSNLIDGLLSNNATMFAQTENRRHSSSLTKRRQTRLNSEVIHDHITQVLAKVNKIPEVPEQEEVGAIDLLLENYHNWSFDIIQLEKLTDNKPLRYIGMKIFSQFDLGTVLNIDGKQFQNWLHVIETNYNDNNCYHNSTHAADVLQSSVWFLERTRINEIFDSYDDVISIIAAIIHDLGHPGRTNPFLINSSHSLAVLYNDIAVLENHHASFAFNVTLKDDRINIFKNMSRDDYRSVRHGIIDAVLATEMAKHFEHLTKFVNNIVNNHEVIRSRTSNSDNAVEMGPSLLMEPENKAIIRRMLIKCSDVNNPTRPFHLCKQWAYRISEEYFSQTDEEISKGLPVVMPQFNRQTCDIPKSQIYFIDIFLQDMFAVWNEFADVEELVTNLNENKENWKSLSDNDDNAKSD